MRGRHVQGLGASVLCAAPALPLLFMGEEYGETAPFQFFTSFLDRDLAEAVRRGRTAEFSRFAWQGTVPDPGDPATFVRSRLSHALASAPRHRELREYYRRWLELRLRHPALGSRHKDRVEAELHDGGSVGTAAGPVLTLRRSAPSGEQVLIIANLTGVRRPQPSTPPEWHLLLDSADVRFAGPGGVERVAPYQLLLYEATR